MTAAAPVETAEYPRYEELCPWHRRQPFGDADPYPRVIRRADAPFSSWAPAPGNSTPSWIYLSTRRMNSGVFSVQPGGWFDPGNHPGPEPYYILSGALHLSNPDVGDVVELRAGDASNIPALAYHHGFNFGDEEVAILWWVPGEMHTEEFKRKIQERPAGEWQWYERTPVTLGGRERNDGFPSQLDALASWPASEPARSEHHMQKLDRTQWLHTLQGTDPRLTALVSFFYADERIRCGEVRLPRSRETEPETSDWEKLYYVTQGNFTVNLTGTGQSLLGNAHDAIYVPPGVTHSLQAFGDDAAVALVAAAR
jgi:quercetin dioxygenase-like cupin family protein